MAKPWFGGGVRRALPGNVDIALSAINKSLSGEEGRPPESLPRLHNVNHADLRLRNHGFNRQPATNGPHGCIGHELSEGKMAAKGRSTHKQAFSPVVGDVIAPAPSGHVAHFASAFQSDVIEAEFEDIADETDDGDAAGYAEPEEPIRFDAASRRLRLFDRDMVLETAAEPPRRFGAFALATLLLCALSFWVFGGHAVFARLAGRGNGIATPLQITGVSTRLGVIDGMRVVFINGRVRNTSGRQRAVPVISLSVDAGTTPTMVRAAAAVLDAGASTDFQVRLPAPGSTIPKVAATFVSVGSTPTSSLAGTALPNK